MCDEKEGWPWDLKLLRCISKYFLSSRVSRGELLLLIDIIRMVE